MFGLNYHPDKANVIANALSGKSLHVSGMMVKEAKLIKSFRDLNLSLNHIEVTSDFKGSLEENDLDFQKTIKPIQDVKLKGFI